MKFMCLFIYCTLLTFGRQRYLSFHKGLYKLSFFFRFYELTDNKLSFRHIYSKNDDIFSMVKR